MARIRTMSAALRRTRGEEEKEEAKDDNEEEEEEDSEDRTLSQRRWSVAPWIVIFTWCPSWVAIGSTGHRQRGRTRSGSSPSSGAGTPGRPTNSIPGTSRWCIEASATPSSSVTMR